MGITVARSGSMCLGPPWGLGIRPRPGRRRRGSASWRPDLPEASGSSPSAGRPRGSMVDLRPAGLHDRDVPGVLGGERRDALW